MVLIHGINPLTIRLEKEIPILHHFQCKNLIIYIIYYYMSADKLKLKKVLKKYKEKYELTKKDFFLFVKEKVELSEKKCSWFIDHMETEIQQQLNDDQLIKLFRLIAAYQADLDLRTIQQQDLAPYYKIKFREKRKNQEIQKISHQKQSIIPQQKKTMEVEKNKIEQDEQKGRERIEQEDQQVQIRISDEKNQPTYNQSKNQWEKQIENQIKSNEIKKADKMQQQQILDDEEQEDKERLYKQIRQQEEEIQRKRIEEEQKLSRQRQLRLREEEQKKLRQQKQRDELKKKQEEEKRREKQKLQKELRESIRKQYQLEYKKKEMQRLQIQKRQLEVLQRQKQLREKQEIARKQEIVRKQKQKKQQEIRLLQKQQKMRIDQMKQKKNQEDLQKLRIEKQRREMQKKKQQVKQSQPPKKDKQKQKQDVKKKPVPQKSLKTIEQEKSEQLSVDCSNQKTLQDNRKKKNSQKAAKLEVIQDNSSKQLIQITKFEKTDQDFMNPIIKYQIVYNQQYYTWRRYSEIQKLLAFLRYKYEGIVLPEMPPKQGIKGSFNYFWRSSVNQQFLDERKQKLKSFLNRLLACQYVSQDQVLQNFLKNEQYQLPNFNPDNSYGSYFQTIVGLKDIVFNYSELKDYGIAYYNYISQYKKSVINTECSQEYTKIQSLMTNIFTINKHRELVNSNFQKRRQIMYENQIKAKGPTKTTFDKILQEAQTECNELNTQFGRYLQLKSTEGWQNELIKQKITQGGEALQKIKENHKKTLERIGKIEQNLIKSIKKFDEKHANIVKQIGKYMMEWRRKGHP